MSPGVSHYRSLACHTVGRAMGVAVFAVVLLCGCVIGKDYVWPTLELPEKFRFDSSEARDLANARWWAQFEDNVLNELIQTALINNFDVRIAAARVEEFYGALGITRSGLFPQAGVEAAVGRDRIPPSGAADRFQVDAFASWEIDMFGRLRRLSPHPCGSAGCVPYTARHSPHPCGSAGCVPYTARHFLHLPKSDLAFLTSPCGEVARSAGEEPRVACSAART